MQHVQAEMVAMKAATAKTEDGFPIDPMQDIVVIEQFEEEKTSLGIILPGDAKKFPCGRVVAHGPGRVYSAYMDASGNNHLAYFVPVTVKVGDWVIFGKYQSGGEPIEWNGRKFLMCREGDLGGVSKSGEPVRIQRARVD